MKALKVYGNFKNQKVQFENWVSPELSEGEVLIEAHWSGLNYKDALAVTGNGMILKKYPLIPGIDVAGIVKASRSQKISVGQKVLVNGTGLGEEQDGGFSPETLANEEQIVALPEGLSFKEAMTLGTAGFTAALAVHRLLENHQTPDKGPILVSGATGGVGSFSIQILKNLGFSVCALTGKSKSTSYLKSLGADEVKSLAELSLGSRPLEKGRFGGAIDNLGGEVLHQLLSHTRLWGNVCSVGLAADYRLETTVMPFILRGVSLLGISSNNCPMKLKDKLWNQLATDWRPKLIDQLVSETISINDIPGASEKLLRRQNQGRIIVQIRP